MGKTRVAIKSGFREDVTVKDKIEKVRALACSLEDICARLSGGVYYEHRGRSALIYLHGLAAAIRQDIEVIESPAGAVAGISDQTEDYPLFPYHDIVWRTTFNRHLEGEPDGEARPYEFTHGPYTSRVEDAKERSKKIQGQSVLRVLPYNLTNIVRGLQRPVFFPRESRNALIGSTLATYAESDYYLATRLDVLSIYDSLHNNLLEALGSLVPSDERSLVRAYVLHLILDQDSGLLERITGFRNLARVSQHVADNGVLQRTTSYLSDLKALAEFPLSNLISGYVELIKAVGKAAGIKQIALKRDILPLERSLGADQSSIQRDDNDYRNSVDGATVDPEQYKRMLAQREKLIKALGSMKSWGNKRVMSQLAKFYYDSNPWNYLTYFEIGQDNHGRPILAPSERKVEPIYVDYTDNLLHLKKWMDAFCSGKPVPNLALTGESGTGKTAALLIASGMYNARVVNLDFKSLEERDLPTIIGLIKNNTQYPMLLYLDNLDVSNSDTIYRLLNNLERYMDGPTSLGNRIKFAMSTSTYDKLPIALKQRYGLRLEFQKPDIPSQLKIAEAYLKHFRMRRSPQRVLKEIYSAKDLAEVKQEQYLAPREIRDRISEIKLAT